MMMSSHDPALQTAADRAAFIAAMRGVASSVTVVATDGPAGRFGATVSAFCSVSADPPSALICLRADSRIARAVVENGAFCVNVLPEGAATLAARFAGVDDPHLADRFTGVIWETDPVGAPMLAGATAFSCRLLDSSVCGSHRIYTGAVAATRIGGGRPLVYLDGAFCDATPTHEGGK